MDSKKENIILVWIKKIKERIINFPKKKLIINLIISLSVFMALVVIDQLCKNLIFTNEQYLANKNGNWNKEEWIDWGIIGFRPLLHQGLTSGIEKIFGFWFIHFICFVILIFCLPFFAFSKKYPFLVAVTLITAGNVGNEIDRFLWSNGVKDYLFIPFYDRGTFNLADFFVISGSILMALSIIWYHLIKPYLDKKNEEKIKEK